MWNASIKQIGRVKNTLEIVVDYTNDEREELNFSDVYTTSVAQDDNWLPNLLQEKLTDLEGLEVFEESLRQSDVFSKQSSVDTNTEQIVFQ